MKLCDFLIANHVPLNLKSYKVHLASVSAGVKSPLQAFYEGEFEEWQAWQSRKNFPCTHIVSLIQLPERDRWLFAGVYVVEGLEQRKEFWYYRTSLIPGHEEWIGRVIVEHHRTGRASYLKGKADGGPFTIAAIREQRMTVADFPGFNWTRVPYAELKTIINQEVPSWKHALVNVKGIYLITDTKTGKQYVGKADGASGLWQRWSTYIWTGHGGNKELRELLGKNPPEYLEHFQFSILEIADSHTSDEDIGKRENHWKEVLQTRQHGYNSN